MNNDDELTPMSWIKEKCEGIEPEVFWNCFKNFFGEQIQEGRYRDEENSVFDRTELENQKVRDLNENEVRFTRISEFIEPEKVVWGYRTNYRCE